MRAAGARVETGGGARRDWHISVCTANEAVQRAAFGYSVALGRARHRGQTSRRVTEREDQLAGPQLDGVVHVTDVGRSRSPLRRQSDLLHQRSVGRYLEQTTFVGAFTDRDDHVAVDIHRQAERTAVESPVGDVIVAEQPNAVDDIIAAVADVEAVVRGARSHAVRYAAEPANDEVACETERRRVVHIHSLPVWPADDEQLVAERSQRPNRVAFRNYVQQFGRCWRKLVCNILLIYDSDTK